MRIIEKVALSLLLPVLMMVNVYGEETSTTTKAEPATQETTTTEKTEGCGIPPACPPDRPDCCSETVPQEKPSTE